MSEPAEQSLMFSQQQNCDSMNGINNTLLSKSQFIVTEATVIQRLGRPLFQSQLFTRVVADSLKFPAFKTGFLNAAR
jgi:hypothetical protein